MAIEVSAVPLTPWQYNSMGAVRRSGSSCAFGKDGERGGQSALGIDAVHLADLDERNDEPLVFGSCVVACEVDVLPVQGDG